MNVSRYPLNIEKNSKFNNDLYNILSNYLQNVKRQTFDLNDYKFYENNSGTIKIYNIKSKMMDLFILIAIMLYHFIIYAYLKGAKGTIKGIRNFIKNEE